MIIAIWFLVNYGVFEMFCVLRKWTRERITVSSTNWMKYLFFIFCLVVIKSFTGLIFYYTESPNCLFVHCILVVLCICVQIVLFFYFFLYLDATRRFGPLMTTFLVLLFALNLLGFMMYAFVLDQMFDITLALEKCPSGGRECTQ